MISSITTFAAVTTTEGGQNFFELHAGDTMVLIVSALAVGFIHWLKWLSEPPSRRGHPTKLIGDTGLAMSLFIAAAAGLHYYGLLNMPLLVIVGVAIGMFKKDIQKAFQKFIQERATPGILALFRALVGSDKKDGEAK